MFCPNKVVADRSKNRHVLELPQSSNHNTLGGPYKLDGIHQLPDQCFAPVTVLHKYTHGYRLDGLRWTDDLIDMIFRYEKLNTGWHEQTGATGGQCRLHLAVGVDCNWRSL
jgi:hypothetical protein